MNEFSEFLRNALQQLDNTRFLAGIRFDRPWVERCRSGLNQISDQDSSGDDKLLKACISIVFAANTPNYATCKTDSEKGSQSSLFLQKIRTEILHRLGVMQYWYDTTDDRYKLGKHQAVCNVFQKAAENSWLNKTPIDTCREIISTNGTDRTFLTEEERKVIRMDVHIFGKKDRYRYYQSKLIEKLYDIGLLTNAHASDNFFQTEIWHTEMQTEEIYTFFSKEVEKTDLFKGEYAQDDFNLLKGRWMSEELLLLFNTLRHQGLFVGEKARDNFERLMTSHVDERFTRKLFDIDIFSSNIGKRKELRLILEENACQKLFDCCIANRSFAKDAFEATNY